MNWQNVADKILKRVVQEWKAQGHDFTNSFEGLVRTFIEEKIGFITIVGELPYYARYVNTGVPANKIPYSLPSGRGGTSKYIEALMRFAESRGFDNPKSAAFAIAAKHIKEGMPTEKSKRFSQTGQRVGFLQEAIKDITPELTELINNEFFAELKGDVDKMFNDLGNFDFQFTF